MTIRKINYTVIAPEVEADIKDAYVHTFTANSQDNMLALTGVKVGDMCIRSDINNTLFLLKAINTTVLENWQQITPDFYIIP